MLAALASASAWAGGYTDNTLTLQMIDELVADEGFERDALLEVFGQAERKDSILKAIARPAEKTKPWHEYRQIFVTSKRTAKGVDFYQRHRATLERAEAEFGVPAEMITAVIGVETRYGENMGSFRVIDALSTLAFDYPPRSPFFSKELKQYLILTREQSMPATEMKGSYAGAMGYGQFMPSSYRAYAVDFDGDDVIDIWNNPVDAIGSVANYFKRHGWRRGETVTVAATVSPGYKPELANDGLKPQRTVADFTAAGYRPAVAVPAEAKATVMEFEGSEGLEHWFGLHNFYVITRYNHSAMYAMSVYQLSQELARAQSAL
tara:strand:+ start:695 stop:1654 length:960 start_codon:yes stop_codon:yes gene_type:complete